MDIFNKLINEKKQNLIFANTLPKALHDVSVMKWEEFVKVCVDKDIIFKENSNFCKVMQYIFTFSDFIYKYCISKPELFFNLIKEKDLERSYIQNTYENKLNNILNDTKILDSENKDELNKKFRNFRLYEMIRIAFRDITGLADLFEVMNDLSNLADACIKNAVKFLYNWQIQKFGTPFSETCKKQELIVLGLGKLGGRELNFSSDIDLIFAYPKKGKTKNGTKSITNEEFFTRLCRDFLKVMVAKTNDGNLYRVDMRLRPYGESGPIVMNFDTIEDYYQIQGREWERYALIKARVITGKKQDGKQLLSMLRPFIYRKYIDFGVFDSIREMKKKIEVEIKRKKITNNIKLGYGGIREIEFFGQVFQLIRGGVMPRLQVQSILKVLQCLNQNRYISNNEYLELRQAYIFLRTVENRLQEFDDQQVHDIWQDQNLKLTLSLSMGFAKLQDFENKLEDYKKNVHKNFEMLLSSSTKEPGSHKRIKTEMSDIWHCLYDEKENIKILTSFGFDLPETILSILNNMRNDHTTKTLSAKGRAKYDKLIPQILERLVELKCSTTTLKRVFNVITAIQKRTCYFSLLLENPTALTHLIKLTEKSSWLSLFIAHHPAVLDELLDPQVLYILPQKQDIEKELDLRFSKIDLNDLEYQMDELRIFRQTNTLRIAAADTTGKFSVYEISKSLTYLAEVILNKTLEISWNHLINKYGLPLCYMDNKAFNKGFAIIAYGKLGGGELGYASDLDLVFLHAAKEGKTDNKNGMSIENIQFFGRLGQRIVHILTSLTSAGLLYKTDMRLRPSGSSGLLVSHIDVFDKYQTDKAWTWEHQAIIKARPICGNSLIADRFNKIRKQVLIKKRDTLKLKKQVSQMREKLRKEQLKINDKSYYLKQGVGGILDIEFLVQFLILDNAYNDHELVKFTEQRNLLEALFKKQVIDKNIYNDLKDAYLAYRSQFHKLSLQEKDDSIPKDKFLDFRKKVSEYWDQILSNHDPC